MRTTRRHQQNLLSGVRGAGGSSGFSTCWPVAAATAVKGDCCMFGGFICVLEEVWRRKPACANSMSVTLLVHHYFPLPLFSLCSDALCGAADRADPCRKLLQHHRASSSTEDDHTYPGKVSDEHLPTAPSQSRSKVGRLWSSLLHAVSTAALQRVCKYSPRSTGALLVAEQVGTPGQGLLFTLCS